MFPGVAMVMRGRNDTSNAPQDVCSLGEIIDASLVRTYEVEI